MCYSVSTYSDASGGGRAVRYMLHSTVGVSHGAVITRNWMHACADSQPNVYIC